MLAVVRMLFRAEFRHRWRSWMYLALFVALVSGLVLAGMAAGRRTASAFPRYVAAYGSDAEVFSFKPLPTIASLPEVEESTSVLIPANGPPACSGCRLLANQNFGIVGLAPQDLAGHVKLLSGRMPDQSNPSEVLASYTMQRDLGIHLGSHIRIRFASVRQRNEVLSGADVTPDGPLYDFKVVGTEASEDEFPATSGTNYGLYTTKAFIRSINDRTVFFHADFVRLRHGAADLPRFQAQARQVGALGITDLDTNAAAVTSSIRPQAVGWWILAALTALVGLIVLAQAQSRQASIEEDAYGTLRTLGVSGRQLFLAGMARTAAIGVVGVVGGVLLAYGLSSLTPVGEARLAEPTNGFSFDTWALLVGGLVLLAVFLVLGAWPAVTVARAARTGGRYRRQRPSRTVGLLGRTGRIPQHTDRRSPCHPTRWRPFHCSGWLRPRGFDPGRDRTVCHRGLWVQPHPPDYDALPLRAALRPLHQRQQHGHAGSGRAAGRRHRAGTDRHRDHCWPLGRRQHQRPHRGRPGGTIDPRVAALDDNHRAAPRCTRRGHDGGGDATRSGGPRRLGRTGVGA